MESSENMLRRIRDGIAGLLFRLLSLLPIDNKKIVVQSFYGNAVSGNPKYLLIELIRNYHEDYRIVIITRDPAIFMGIRTVRKRSVAYLYHMATAKYWINNGRLAQYLRRREETVYLQTWHGTPLKRLVFDVKGSETNCHTEEYKESFRRQASYWSYLISANSMSTQAFRSAFRYEHEIIETGYPRNDIFYREHLKELAEENLQKLRIPEHKIKILVAPTFRDDDRGNMVILDDIQRIAAELQDTHVFLVRAHYLFSGRQEDEDIPGVMNVTSYDDVQELMLASDCLITDYSSVMFDFAHTDRPIILYPLDYDLYGSEIRGFYFDIKERAPGPVCMSVDELRDAIEHMEEHRAVYAEQYRQFKQDFCYLEDGGSSKKVLETVLGHRETVCRD